MKLRVGSPQWRKIRNYLLARSMYRAACTDTVAAARLKQGCAEEVQGVGIMEAVVACLPTAIQLEAKATAAELEEALRSVADALANLPADDPGLIEDENRAALAALKEQEELLWQQLDIYDHLLREFPEVGLPALDTRDL